MWRFPVLGSVLAFGALTVLSAGGTQQVTVRDLLRDIAEASDSDWAAVTRGEPFAKVLATDAREIAVAGRRPDCRRRASGSSIATARSRT